MRVSLIRTNTLFRIDELSDELTRPHPPDTAAMLLHETARSYHIAALSTLLVEADIRAYRRLLVQGGEARVKLLKLLRQHGIQESTFNCASLLDPFFGCIVAQKLDVAREIVGLSPARWLEEEEYEDDFWYAHLLHTLVCLGPSDPSLGKILAEMTRSLGDERSARLLASQGLVERDQSLFDSGITQMIDERAEHFDDKRGTIVRDVDGYETERHLFLEGAALLNIATWIGLTTAREYRFIPSFMR